MDDGRPITEPPSRQALEQDEEPIIRFVDVCKAFDEQIVLDHVSLDIPRNRTTVIVGPSGTGKSVLLKHIVGLMRPDSGRVVVFGEDIAALNQPGLVRLRKRFGMLFQDGALFGSMTVGENIAFPLVHHTRLSRAAIRRKVAEKLALVGLPGIEHKYPSELSGGMRKRVALARAIVLEPEVVLFDEPQSGLDPLTADAIDDLILEMKERLKVTFVVISHDIVGTFRIADTIGMLYRGRIVATGTPDDFRRTTDPLVRRFLARNLVEPPVETGSPASK